MLKRKTKLVKQKPNNSTDAGGGEAANGLDWYHKDHITEKFQSGKMTAKGIRIEISTKATSAASFDFAEALADEIVTKDLNTKLFNNFPGCISFVDLDVQFLLLFQPISEITTTKATMSHKICFDPKMSSQYAIRTPDCSRFEISILQINLKTSETLYSFDIGSSRTRYVN